MAVAFYLFWFLFLALYIIHTFRKMLKKMYIAIDALEKIASTNYDMNKLVCIAIKALNDIDNLK